MTLPKSIRAQAQREATRRTIFDLHAQGLSYAQIAQRIRSSETAVCSHVFRARHPHVPEPQVSSWTWTDDTIAELRALVDSGLSISEAGRRLGCGRSSAISKMQKVRRDMRL